MKFDLHGYAEVIGKIKNPEKKFDESFLATITQDKQRRKSVEAKIERDNKNRNSEMEMKRIKTNQ